MSKSHGTVRALKIIGENDMVEKGPILIIDDDPDFTDTLSQILTTEGYITDIAHTGAEAMLKIENEFYPLLLIDVNLPDGDGIDMIKLLDWTEPKIRKIIITGYPSIENAKKAVTAGADDYMVKPIQVHDLLKKLSEQLHIWESEIRERYISLEM